MLAISILCYSWSSKSLPYNISFTERADLLLSKPGYSMVFVQTNKATKIKKATWIMRTCTVILHTWILRPIFKTITSKYVRKKPVLWVFITRTPAFSRNFINFQVNMPTKITLNDYTVFHWRDHTDTLLWQLLLSYLFGTQVISSSC